MVANESRHIIEGKFCEGTMMVNDPVQKIHRVPYYALSCESEPATVSEPGDYRHRTVNGDGELIVEAQNFLSAHQQADLWIRIRTANYLLKYQRASQVEVAAALLADLPKGEYLKGINLNTVLLARRYSNLFSFEEIENENTDFSPLAYRVWRCIAECSEVLDQTELKHSLDRVAYLTSQLVPRWFVIAFLASVKSHPQLRHLGAVLKARTEKVALLLRFEPGANLGFRVEGTESVLDEFSRLFGLFFQLDQKRHTRKELWISHHYLPIPAFARLVDWIQERFGSRLRISDLDIEEVAEIPYKEYGECSKTWLQTISEVLGGQSFIDPAEKILPLSTSDDIEGQMLTASARVQSLISGMKGSSWDSKEETETR